MPFEVGDRRPAEVVVADAADERHGRAEARRHHRLVRPLAAEPLLIAVGDQGLAFVGHALAVGDLVDHHRADDDDRRHVGRIGQTHGRHRVHEAARLCGGRPADQPRVEAHGPAGAGDVARQAGEQHAHGDGALVLHVAVDDRERRIEKVGEEVIVEADDRHGPRHCQTEIAQRPQQADGHQVVGGERRARRVGGGEQPHRRLVAAALLEIGDLDDDLDIGALHTRRRSRRGARRPGWCRADRLTKAMRRCPSSISSRAAAAAPPALSISTASASPGSGNVRSTRTIGTPRSASDSTSRRRHAPAPARGRRHGRGWSTAHRAPRAELSSVLHRTSW